METLDYTDLFELNKKQRLSRAEMISGNEHSPLITTNCITAALAISGITPYELDYEGVFEGYSIGNVNKLIDDKTETIFYADELTAFKVKLAEIADLISIRDYNSRFILHLAVPHPEYPEILIQRRGIRKNISYPPGQSVFDFYKRFNALFNYHRLRYDLLKM